MNVRLRVYIFIYIRLSSPEFDDILEDILLLSDSLLNEAKEMIELSRIFIEMFLKWNILLAMKSSRSECSFRVVSAVTGTVLIWMLSTV